MNLAPSVFDDVGEMETAKTIKAGDIIKLNQGCVRAQASY